MMKWKWFSWSLMGLIAFLFLALSLPMRYAEKMRGTTAALFSPFWRLCSVNREGTTQEEAQRLLLENQLLVEEVRRLREQQNFENNSDEQEALLLAHIIYRSPSTWSTSLWIDRGEEENRGSDRRKIALHSPVVLGHSLVGMIDYVGKKISRVRLVTDSSLCASVRAVRGKESDQFFLHQLEALHHIFVSREECREEYLHLRQTLAEAKASQFLAKGEIHGSRSPLWRKERNLLVGTGFNYDFVDQKSVALDLRRGLPVGSIEGEPIPLIQEGDLLITTGLDGLFPPGLFVGEVCSVAPLKEGDYYYDITALPTAGNFDELSFVFVLPPWSEEQEECPFPMASWRKS